MKQYPLLALLIFLLSCSEDLSKVKPSTGADSSATASTGMEGQTRADTTKQLSSTDWQLNYMTGIRTSFEELFPAQKPIIHFDFARNQVTGNTGCNFFEVAFSSTEDLIDFKQPKTMADRCKGNSESFFLSSLSKVSRYTLTEGNTLSFLQGDLVLMRFTKKQ